MTTNRKLSLSLGIAVIVIAAGTAIAQNVNFSGPSSYPSTPASAGSTTPATAASSTASAYTLAQVAQHDSGTSCWTAINGSVYDVTTWINQHPGGPEAILSLCGTDGSAAFNAQHGGESRPESELATFKIGILTQ